MSSHGTPLSVCLDASPPTVPHCRCVPMPALPYCLTAVVPRCQPYHCGCGSMDGSPPTVLHCRRAATLAFPRCPTMAVKSDSAYDMRYSDTCLWICLMARRRWQRQTARPHTTPLALIVHAIVLAIGWGGVGDLADGSGPGVCAAPARPDAGVGARGV